MQAIENIKKYLSEISLTQILQLWLLSSIVLPLLYVILNVIPYFSQN